MMSKFRVIWADGHALDVAANNGTEAKHTARALRGVKKSECKITRVVPIEDAAPSAHADSSAQA